jgi:GNAT superfamily N-acetyltransferase
MSNLIKRIFGKIAYWKRTISLYYYNAPTIPANGLGTSYNFKEINQCVEIESYKIDFNKTDYENRFLNGHIFCVLVFKGILASYGWINPLGKHTLGELDLPMDLGSNIDTLYDFYTFEEFRGIGLYSYLLQKICARNKKAKLIYVLPSNTRSIKGIKKANFQFLGNLKGYNKQRYSSLIKKIWAK